MIRERLKTSRCDRGFGTRNVVLRAVRDMTMPKREGRRPVRPAPQHAVRFLDEAAPLPSRAVRIALGMLESERDFVVRSSLVKSLGRVRSRRRHNRKGGARETWFIDLRSAGCDYLWSHQGVPFRSREHAEDVLGMLRNRVAQGRSLADAVAEFSRTAEAPSAIQVHVRRWLLFMQHEADSGQRSPTYLHGIKSYTREGGPFDHWAGKLVREVDFAALEDWALELHRSGLAAKSVRNVLGAFRSFLGWCRRRGVIDALPDFPQVEVDEVAPPIIAAEVLDAILAEIPAVRRGIFLALAHGLRPGEARALDVRDFAVDASGRAWLTVSKAAKGQTASAPVRSTRTRRVRRIPVDDALREWIEQRTGGVRPGDLLRGPVPLFVNPGATNPDRRWTAGQLRKTWHAACRRVGVQVPLYSGTRHTIATDAVRRGVPENVLQRFLGHADARSTKRYGRLADGALVQVLRPRLGAHLGPSENGVRKRADSE